MSILQHPFLPAFWEYTNVTREHSYQQDETDEGLSLIVKLPGIKKQDIELKYSSKGFINLVIKKDGDPIVNQDIYLQRQINPDHITADLDLGVLTIAAPSQNTDKIIQIR